MMPPINMPPRSLLGLRGQTLIAWAVFEPEWYVSRHALARPGDPEPDAEAVLRYYLTTGQHLGHSPNRWFDEAWHRRTYPNVDAAVSSGQFSSGFEAYCFGGTFRSPHWLFDEPWYRGRYPDLTDAALEHGNIANGYDHYLRNGDVEGRSGHRLFDPRFLVARAHGHDGSTDESPFQNYLTGNQAVAEQQTSVLFDPLWYRQRYPEVAGDIERGEWQSALHHYLCNTTPSAFDPLPEFSEGFYRARYTDLLPSIAGSPFRNGYDHFLKHGIGEHRSPSILVNLRDYASSSHVRRDLEDGTSPDVFSHWLTSGRHAAAHAVSRSGENVSAGLAKKMFWSRAELLRPVLGRSDLKFSDSPKLSAILVVHNCFALTMMALASLHANCAGQVSVILVDSGSTDETRAISRYVSGVTVIRFDENIGYLRGCNAAFQLVRSSAVLLLNNDVELAPAAVRNALRRLHSDARIGAVGAKVVLATGGLQEAGCIIWRDGTTSGYLRNRSPSLPEANFVRDVDYCSGVFLLLRHDAVKRLGGFDEAFVPAYYEDTDLCVRLSLSDYRVIYDPAVVVHHLEHGSTPAGPASDRMLERGRDIFVRKHLGWLAARYVQPGADESIARHAHNRQTRRILFIEDQIPLRSIGSGFVRSNDILRSMVSLDYLVTVFPIRPSRSDLTSMYADIPDTVEVMHSSALSELPDFLASRQGYYDIIWIGRAHNLAPVQAVIQQFENPPAVILDSEAISAVRDAQWAERTGKPFDLLSAVRREFAGAASCRAVVAVNSLEADLLHQAMAIEPLQMGHARQPKPTPLAFSDRSGLLFVGAVHRMDSPNYDSLCWFVDEILPLLEQELTWETRLTVVGFTEQGVTLGRFSQHPRITLRGAVSDIVPLFNAHRVFVAPTRIAAGIPYKIHEAASYGLPVVATTVLQRQLGWMIDEELLAAAPDDPAAFARAIVRLYRDEALWTRLRQGALQRLLREFSEQHYERVLSLALGAPDSLGNNSAPGDVIRPLALRA
jgi:O-antigen biosynthesis protein